MTKKPSEVEQEYFFKLEIEKMKKSRAEHDARLKASEKDKAKEQHYMKCPKCGMDLQEVEFRKIKVDFCASCHGYWFDAGEVMQLIKMENEQHFISRLFKAFTA